MEWCGRAAALVWKIKVGLPSSKYSFCLSVNDVIFIFINLYFLALFMFAICVIFPIVFVLEYVHVSIQERLTRVEISHLCS